MLYTLVFPSGYNGPRAFECSLPKSIPCVSMGGGGYYFSHFFYWVAQTWVGCSSSVSAFWREAPHFCDWMVRNWKGTGLLKRRPLVTRPLSPGLRLQGILRQSLVAFMTLAMWATRALIWGVMLRNHPLRPSHLGKVLDMQHPGHIPVQGLRPAAWPSVSRSCWAG